MVVVALSFVSSLSRGDSVGWVREGVHCYVYEGMDGE